jgi:hypothetical protein
MNNMSKMNFNPNKTMYDVMVNFAFEGGQNESSQAGVERVLASLRPLTENGSGFKNVTIVRLPEKA